MSMLTVGIRIAEIYNTLVVFPRYSNNCLIFPGSSVNNDPNGQMLSKYMMNRSYQSIIQSISFQAQYPRLNLRSILIAKIKKYYFRGEDLAMIPQKTFTRSHGTLRQLNSRLLINNFD